MTTPIHFSLIAIAVLLLIGCSKPAPSKTTTKSAQPTTTQPTTTELVPAETGVGKSGRKLDQYKDDAVQNAVAAPTRALFRAKEAITFDTVQYALKLYKAEHGEGPKTHEDFMRDIIEFNQIQLPELPAGERYVYDPEAEQLMVERPSQSP